MPAKALLEARVNEGVSIRGPGGTTERNVVWIDEPAAACFADGPEPKLPNGMVVHEPFAVGMPGVELHGAVFSFREHGSRAPGLAVPDADRAVIAAAGDLLAV